MDNVWDVDVYNVETLNDSDDLYDLIGEFISGYKNFINNVYKNVQKDETDHDKHAILNEAIIDLNSQESNNHFVFRLDYKTGKFRADYIDVDYEGFQRPLFILKSPAINFHAKNKSYNEDESLKFIF